MAEQQDDLQVAIDAIAQLRGSDDPLAKALAALAGVAVKNAETNGALVDVLSKASKGDDEGDEDEEKDDDTDDGGGDDDTDDGAGYEDMSKASDDDMLDVTEDVQALRKAVADQDAKIERLIGLVTQAVESQQAVSEQMAVLATMDKGLFAHVDGLFKAQNAATIALAKAVTDTQTALSNTAVAGLTPKFTTPQPAPTVAPKLEAPDVAGEFFIGGDERTEQRKLFKAAARGIITQQQYQAFADPLGPRVFDADPAINSSLRAKVAEIPA